MKKLTALVFALIITTPAHSQVATDYRLQDINSTDIYIQSSAPDESFDGAFLETGGSGDKYVTLIKFDISVLPALGSSDKAAIWFFNQSQGGNSTPTPVQMGMRVGFDFNSATTWNSPNLVDGVSTRVVNVSQYGTWTEFEITNYYNYWKNGALPNFGIQLAPVNTNNNFNYFPSSASSTPDEMKPFLRVTTGVYPQRVLRFPLDCANPVSSSCPTPYSRGAYTPARIRSVLDHSVSDRIGSVEYKKDGEITSFTGEIFAATATYPKSTKTPCYPKSVSSATPSWSASLFALYGGTAGIGAENCVPGVALNYDGHPAYDYQAAIGSIVRAAQDGRVVNNTNPPPVGEKNTLCVPKGLNGRKFKGCAAWGAVGIDHGNGYITQYLHLSSITVSAGAAIHQGDVIGLSGDTAVKGQPHLHFEVLKLRPGVLQGNYIPDNYATVDPYGFDLSSGTLDGLAKSNKVQNTCLWQLGCALP